jgi:dTDP-4-amino-4,6-dideoxygalactose transaminase
LPHTERAAQEVLSLPIYPELSAAAADDVVRAVIAALGARA